MQLLRAATQSNHTSQCVYKYVNSPDYCILLCSLVTQHGVVNYAISVSEREYLYGT